MFRRNRIPIVVLLLLLLLQSSPGQAVAAIPCEELATIRDPRGITASVTPASLPLQVIDMLASGEPADRDGAVTADESIHSRVEMAAENQFRCLEYGNSAAFMGNATPDYRMTTAGDPNVDRDADYIEEADVHVTRFEPTLVLNDGRFLIDFAASIDGESAVQGELVFVEHRGAFYLDATSLTTDMVTGTTHEVVITERPLRKSYVVNLENGDTVIFTNTTEDSSASIIITTADGERIFEGFAGGTGLVGGENENVFVALNLESGDYTATISMYPGDVVSTITLRISD